MQRGSLKKVITVGVTSTILLSSVVGCANTSKDTKVGDTASTITYWSELNANVAANYNSLGETELGKALQEQTGVNIEFQHPAVGQTAEQFSLLLTKNKLPDIIEYNWLTYSGGPEKAIEDAVIISLNEYIDEYAPNFKAFLEENPEIDKMVKTDDGTYYAFPFIRGGDMLMVSTGLMLRADWLEDLGLEIPETMDDWYEVLTAFKNEKGATAPFTYFHSNVALTNNNPFAYGCGTTRDFYMMDGEIIYGGVQDEYKKYLETMHQWMKEGLIDLDLATVTGDQVTAKITNGTSGASFGYAGSGLGVWIDAGVSSDPDYSLVAAPYPTMVEGETPEFGQRDNAYIGTGSAAISATASEEAIIAALTVLDYAYSEKGHALYNFGIEGVSYTVEDGANVFVDSVLNHPDMSTAHSLSGYIRATYNGPFVQDIEYATQFYQKEEQVNALQVWSDTNAAKHIIPPITPSASESSEISKIMNSINTYRDEMSLSFILGTKSFDSWDEYVETIESLNLARALEIENDALARYESR